MTFEEWKLTETGLSFYEKGTRIMDYAKAAWDARQSEVDLLMEEIKVQDEVILDLNRVQKKLEAENIDLTEVIRKLEKYENYYFARNPNAEPLG